MPWIKTLPVDLNRFWEKTPTALKFFLLIAVIFVASYLLFSRTGATMETNKLTNIQRSIDRVYLVFENFQKFQTYQLEFNKSVAKDIDNLYKLIDELNYTTDEKIKYVINHHDQTDTQLILKIDMLNVSLGKLIEAYMNSATYPTLPEFKEWESK